MKPVEKAIAAYNNIIQDPDKWDQSIWRCGTGCCFGGHIGLVTGWKFVPNPSERLSDAPDIYPYMEKDGITRHVERVAEFELELGQQFFYDNDTPIDLFSGSNDLDDIRNGMERIWKVELVLEGDRIIGYVKI